LYPVFTVERLKKAHQAKLLVSAKYLTNSGMPVLKSKTFKYNCFCSNPNPKCWSTLIQNHKYKEVTADMPVLTQFK